MNTEPLKYRLVFWSWLISFCCLPFFMVAQQEENTARPFRQAVINEGIKVAFSMDHVDSQKSPGLFRVGDDVRFRFSITDTLSKEGISGAYPAAWMDPSPVVEEDCIKKVATFITGSILAQPDINLNSYYVLTLNTGPTIAVVDPLFGYGGSQLLALIELKSPGMDWVASKDQNFVFVSMPDSRQVAVINTANWKVVDHIDLEAPPHKLMIQTDGQYLWVACHGDQDKGEASGVAVIDVNTRSLKQFINTGNGAHDLLIDENDRYVYVSNQWDNNLSVIDAHSFKPIKNISTCDHPSAMDYSSLAGAVYVISEETGGLTVIDAQQHTLITSLQLEPGICQVTFEPQQRYAFIVNPLKDNLSILDASINRVVQVGDMESEPDQVNFTQTLAYIRHRNSELILMVPLANIGNEELPVTVIDFPGGQYPPGKMRIPCLASGIVQAPGESAVLVANAPDKTIYFYSEGMAAPMGNFNNYNEEPRAVMVIDRSLKEVTSGVYETTVKLRNQGMHDVAFFMDVPRFVHCFKVNIEPDPELLKAQTIERLGALTVTHLPPRRYINKGEKFPVNFSLTDKMTNKLRADLTDVQVMFMGISGSHHFRRAVKANEEGIFSTEVVFSEPGVYYMYVESHSGGLHLNNPQYRTMYVVDPSSSSAPK